MSKKQEALRRGLRTFIEDTSRELADLEGRPLRRPPDPPAETEADAAANTIVTPAEVAAADHAPPDVEPEPPPRPVKPVPPRDEVRAGHAPAVGPSSPPASEREPVAPTMPPKPEPAARPAPTPPAPEPPAAPSLSSAARAAPPQTRRAPASPAPAAGQPAAEPPAASAPVIPAAPSIASPEAPPSPTRRPAGQASPPVQPRTPRPRAQTAARRRPRPSAEIGDNGISPAQAHARKGVCFAYFLNHDCWRVPDAYCTTALQVCITRECPIYHLHKDAMERRFAKKFKHFW